MILDSSVLSRIVSKDSNLRAKTAKFLATTTELRTSVIVAYEIENGLLRWNANQSLSQFRDLCATSIELIDLTPAMAQLSAKVRASQESNGRIFHTEDLLIGATATVLGLPIVTFNAKDFNHWGIEIINPDV